MNPTEFKLGEEVMSNVYGDGRTYASTLIGGYVYGKAIVKIIASGEIFELNWSQITKMEQQNDYH